MPQISVYSDGYDETAASTGIGGKVAVDGVAVSAVKFFFDGANGVFEVDDADGNVLKRFSAPISDFGGSVKMLGKLCPGWSIDIGLNG